MAAAIEFCAHLTRSYCYGKLNSQAALLERLGLSLPFLWPKLVESKTAKHQLNSSRQNRIIDFGMALKISILITLISVFQKTSSLSIDCHPDANATEKRCLSRGCVWRPKPTPRAPWCEFDHWDDPDAMAGYDSNAEYVETRNGTERNFSAKLRRRPTPTLFGDDFQKAMVRIEHVTNEIVRVIMLDQKNVARRALHPRWEKNLGNRTASIDDDDAILAIETENRPFGFALMRKSTGNRLIDTRRIPGLTFARQYLQISTRVPSQFVYGLGESTHDQLKHKFDYRRWGLFTRDHAIGDPEMNLFGVHPFYLCLEDSRNAHGVFFLNTHAMNVALQPDPSDPDRGIITWRSIGGALEFFIFAGPTPDDVIRQYTDVIGRPQFPPYWSMGFQLSRWGYTNLTYLETVFQRNRRAQIPQDVQVIDLDYFYQRMDFTTDPVAFRNLTGFTQSLHRDYRMRLVLIIDPALASQPKIQYEPLNEGLKLGVFVKDNRTGKPLRGKVWPGETFFSDFSNPATTIWWTKQLKDFHAKQNIEFDGLWIDMNEPSNFVDGSLTGCANNSYTNPPYNPLIYSNINEMTLCMDADHFAGKHYELHNLYGFMEARSTYKALRAIYPGKRPFVLSRSTFAGSGKFTNHWTGDSTSNWPQLKDSIVTTLEFGMFGMPLMGADICGFHDNATEELCLRWHQVGAFYPFSRNHNDISATRDQDPAAWSPNTTDAIRNALLIRYGLLPYLYTLLHASHVNGTPVARPLFFDYFVDDTIVRNIDDQFMWGRGLMIAPIWEEGAVKRSVYFPKGRWYDFIGKDEVARSNESRSIEIDVPLDSIKLYLRGGSILPWQNPAATTAVSRRNPFGLFVGLDEEHRAIGSLYWDDGESEDPAHSVVRFEAWNSRKKGGLRIGLSKNGYTIEPKLDNVTVCGVHSKPSYVLVDSVAVGEEKSRYDPERRTLYVFDLKLDLGEAHEIEWILEKDWKTGFYLDPKIKSILHR